MALIAQSVFLLERGHTDTHTVRDATDHATHGLATLMTTADETIAVKHALVVYSGL